MRVLIVDNNSAERNAQARAGGRRTWAELYEHALAVLQPNIHTDTVNPYVRVPDPAFLTEFDGFAFSGSGVDWAVDAPEAAPLRRVMEQALATGRPVIGSCNGMQLGALVLGGRVGASPKGVEIGLAHDIRLTKAGRAHPLMAGREDVYSAPCIHRDEVQDLSQHATLIAQNDHCPVQAFACQTGGVDFWGVQYHPELPPADLAALIKGVATLNAEHRDVADALAEGSTPPSDGRYRLREIANWLDHLSQTRRA